MGDHVQVSLPEVALYFGTFCGTVKWVPAKGWWCSAAGKVTTGVAESNGSLVLGAWPAGWLPVHWDQLRVHRSVKIMGSLYLVLHRVKSRYRNLWSRYDLYVVGRDAILCKVNWWRFVTLFKYNCVSRFKKSLVLATDRRSDWSAAKCLHFLALHHGGRHWRYYVLSKC